MAQFGDLIDMHANGIDGSIQAVEVCDMDQDGVMDLLVNTSPGGFGYMLGQGDGSYAGFQILADTINGTQVLVQDVGGDGDMDLFFLRRVVSDSTHIVFRECIAPLAYGPQQVIARYKGETIRFEVGDLDNDGDLDIVLVYGWLADGWTPYQSSLSWIRNDGVNGWSGVISITGTSSGRFFDVSLVDVDNDDDPDIVLGSSNSTFSPVSTVSVWRVDGAGQFTYSGSYGTAGSACYYTQGIDVDVDGDQDVLARHNDGSSVLLNDGTGLFTPGQLIDATCLAVGDLDTDGDNDLIVPGGWYENDGTGVFQDVHPTWPLAVDLVWQRAKDAVVTVDPELDGDLDLIVAGGIGQNNLDLCTNPGIGPVGPPVDLLPQFLFDSGELITTDVDHDGYADVIAGGQGCIRWFKALGGGGFADPGTVCRTKRFALYMTLVDIEQDGDMDLVYYDDGTSNLMLIRDEGGGEFSLPVDIIFTDAEIGSTGVSDIRVADMDADGDLDILTDPFTEPTALWYANDGNGMFGDPQPLPFTDFWDIAAMADFNNDGADDIIGPTVSNSNLLGRSVYLNDGTGAFTLSDTIPKGDLASFMVNPVAADLDDDGDMDLIFETSRNSSTYGRPQIAWARNDGENGWSEPIGLSYSNDNSLDGSIPLPPQDVDGDGMTDLMYMQYGNESCNIKFLKRLGGVTFGPAETIYSHDHGSEDYNHLFFPGTIQALDAQAPNDVLFVTDSRPVWVGNFGGSPYHVRGRVFHDQNENAVYDADEPVMPQVLAQFAPAGYGSLSFSNGQYVITATEGAYTIDAATILDPNLWQPTTPDSYTVQLTPEAPISAGNDFGYHAIVDTSIVHVELVEPIGPCGDDASFWVHINNAGTRIEHGTITIELDPQMTPILYDFAPPPATVNGQTLSWPIAELSYTEHFSIHGAVTLPSVTAMGDVIGISASVVLEDAVGAPVDTLTRSLSWVLACAYDPNDKSVSPAGYGSAGAIDIATEKLDYTIRFQNTGTARAYTVVLKDQLSADLDINSLELVAFSHQPTTMTVDPNRLLTVTFLNIMLPDSGSSIEESQGFIIFSIKPNSPAVHMTEIDNSAEIYFDFNPAIITNTTRTTLVDCDLWEPTIANPANDVLEATEGDTYQWYLDEAPIAAANERWLLLDALGAYSVEVTSEYGCTALSENVNIIALTIPDNFPSSLALVPNPFTHQTRLIFDQRMTADHTVDLIDVHGRVLRSMVGSGTKELLIPRDDLSAGLYVVRILSEAGVLLGTAHMVVE